MHARIDAFFVLLQFAELMLRQTCLRERITDLVLNDDRVIESAVPHDLLAQHLLVVDQVIVLAERLENSMLEIVCLLDAILVRLNIKQHSFVSDHLRLNRRHLFITDLKSLLDCLD